VSVAAPPRTTRARRLAGWAAFAVAAIAVGVIGASLAQSSQWTQRGALDPESAGPEGARAVARVLAEQGVEVRVVRDRDAARRALADSPGGATLVLPDAPALSDAALTDLADAADDTVLIQPRSRTLELFLPGSSPAGAAPGTPLAPECDFAPAAGAGAIVAGGLYAPGPGIDSCYRLDDAAALLVTGADGDRTVAVDGFELLANDAVADEGNAALALGLLGRNPVLVWYVPSLADGDGTSAPTLGELTPAWVTPSILLLVAAAVAAGLWRGRRFGPLVAENLPVSVRASETSAGRARLYARSGDAAHALEQLRAGARERLAILLGLGATASADVVADAVVQRTGAERAVVRSILIDAVPRDDHDLVAVHERLIDLEARVRAAVRPEGPPR
jgi:hypothetical protein